MLPNLLLVHTLLVQVSCIQVNTLLCQTKCEQYWPDPTFRTQEKYGDIVVTFDSVIGRDGYQITSFYISHSQVIFLVKSIDTFSLRNYNNLSSPHIFSTFSCDQVMRTVKIITCRVLPCCNNKFFCLYLTRTYTAGRRRIYSFDLKSY